MCPPCMFVPVFMLNFILSLPYLILPCLLPSWLALLGCFCSSDGVVQKQRHGEHTRRRAPAADAVAHPDGQQHLIHPDHHWQMSETSKADAGQDSFLRTSWKIAAAFPYTNNSHITFNIRLFAVPNNNLTLSRVIYIFSLKSYIL